VLSLCAGLESFQSMSDTIVYALIVASFKVQTVEVFVASPVATKQCIASFKHHRACNPFFVVMRKNNDDVISHFFTDFAEEIYVERWCAPLAVECIEIETDYIAPVLFFKFTSVMH